MITKEDYQYIEEVFNKKDTAFKPDVRRVVRIFNENMPDGKHVFNPLRDTICCCNLRPYIIQLYRKLQNTTYKDESNTEDAPEIKDEKEDVKEDAKTIVEDRPKPHKKKKVKKTKN